MGGPNHFGGVRRTSAEIAMACRSRLRPPIAVVGNAGQDGNGAFAYIPIPKNGTSRVKQALLAHLGHTPPVNTHMHKRRMPWTAPLASTIADKGLYRFAFVRNPWRRVYSTWRDKVVHGSRANWLRPLAGVPAGIDFNAFVEWIIGIRYEFLDEHLRPQSMFVGLDTGECIDFIGRVERLETDWETPRRRLGLPPLGPRSSRRAPAPAQWDIGTVRRIAAYYQEDVERFGYPTPDAE